MKSIPIESIPGLDETGYRPATRITRGQHLEESQDIDTLTNMLKAVLNAVSPSRNVLYHIIIIVVVCSLI